MTYIMRRTTSGVCSEFWNVVSEAIGMNDQIVWNTHVRIPDRIAPAAETNCHLKPKFAAGRAGAFADTT